MLSSLLRSKRAIQVSITLVYLVSLGDKPDGPDEPDKPDKPAPRLASPARRALLALCPTDQTNQIDRPRRGCESWTFIGIPRRFSRRGRHSS